MKQIKTLSVCGILAGLLLAGRTSWACTGGAFVAGDGGVVVGRTLEFGKPLDSVIAIWPADSEFIGQTPSGNNGLKFTSKYGFLGATAATNYDMLLDGINDQGLNVGVFYFPGYAQYAEPTPENAAKGLAPAQVAAWILGNCANVAETKERIGEIALLPVVIGLLGIVPDLHIKVQDAAGGCIVIEPRGGKLVVHDNPVRVLTNAPDFPWMLTNLNNYLNMSSAYPSAQKIGDLHLSPFGMGGGSVGLPGDFTPPSRFVRMTFFMQNALPQPDTSKAVSTLFHILNNFDIPPGSAMPPAGTAEKFPDYTTWTAVSDLKKKQFHWKTYGHPDVRVVDLAQALQAAGKTMTTMEMGPQNHTAAATSKLVRVE